MSRGVTSSKSTKWRSGLFQNLCPIGLSWLFLAGNLGQKKVIFIGNNFDLPVPDSKNYSSHISNVLGSKFFEKCWSKTTENCCFPKIHAMNKVENATISFLPGTTLILLKLPVTRPSPTSSMCQTTYLGRWRQTYSRCSLRETSSCPCT